MRQQCAAQPSGELERVDLSGFIAAGIGRERQESRSPAIPNGRRPLGEPGIT
jgi:hypothetical protein